MGRNEPQMSADVHRWEYAEIGVATEGQPIYFQGVNLWEYEWISLPEVPVKLRQPQHRQQLHKLDHYEIHTDEQTITFVAGELSASVWGSYLATQAAP